MSLITCHPIRILLRAVCPYLPVLFALPLRPAPAQFDPTTQRHADLCPNCPRPTAVVLDFPQAPRAAEYRDECRQLRYQEKPVATEKDRRGWYFGSQDVYTNSNNGRIMADLMADALDQSGLFKIRSRSDVKLYYADKRDILSKKLGLAGKDLDAALLKLNPVMIGREMGVDKVVIGYVVDAELRHSRTFGYFASVASVNVSIYDTRTGNVEFALDMDNYRPRSTSYGNLEEMADEFSNQARTWYANYNANYVHAVPAPTPASDTARVNYKPHSITPLPTPKPALR